MMPQVLMLVEIFPHCLPWTNASGLARCSCSYFFPLNWRKKYTELAFPKVYSTGIYFYGMFIGVIVEKNPLESNNLGKSGLNKGNHFLFTTELLTAFIMLKCVVELRTGIQRAELHRLLSPQTLFLPQILLDDWVFISPYFETCWSNSFPFAEKFTSNEWMWIKRERQWNLIHLSKRPFEELSVLNLCAFFPRTGERADHLLIKWGPGKQECMFHPNATEPWISLWLF